MSHFIGPDPKGHNLMNVIASDDKRKKISQRLEKAFETRVNNIKKATALADSALQESKEVKDDYLMAFSHTYLGYFEMIQSNHNSSLKHAKQGIKYFEKNNVKDGLALAYLTVGSVKYKTDNYHLALKYLLDSFQMYQDIEDQIGQSRTLKAIGTVYEFFKEYDKAEETYQKCIDISRAVGDKNGLSNAINPLSGIYLKKGRKEDALKIINQSIALKKETGDRRGLGFAYYGLAKVHLAQEAFDKAEKYLTKSLEIHTEMNELVGAMMTLNKQGLLYFKTEANQKAKSALEECIDKGKKSKHFLIMHKSYKLLYEIAKQEENHVLALEFLELHLMYRDKVINLETKNVINSIQSMSRLELLEKETKWQKEVNNKIERKNTELDSFVYKVSHDLRGPISSLMGLFDLVKYDVTDNKSLEYFEIYNRQVNRLNGILMDFLNLIQIKEKEIQNEVIDFDDLIQGCLNSFQYHENFGNIDFKIEIKHSVVFSSDKSTITSILQNLLENSIKYANIKNSPFVKIRVEKFKKGVSIKVTDNGLGIKKDHQKKIFDMFFRSHEKIKGTGLGLYLVKCAVDKLNGTIDVESKLKNGTSIKVLIP